MVLTSIAIKFVDDALRNARAERARTVSRVIKACRHKSIGECDYLHSEWGRSMPPRRVCMKCGLSEDGWSCGYLVLRSAAPLKLSRENVYSLSTVHIENDDEGPLLRKEVTLGQLINKRLGLEVPA